MAKWWDNSIAPKRNFKWRMVVDGIPAWVLKTCQQPRFESGEGTAVFLNHTFKYPGRQTWQDIEFTLQDPGDPDMAGRILMMIYNAGYVLPSFQDPDLHPSTVCRKRFDKLQDMELEQFGCENEILGSWKVYNPWIKNYTPSDLDYENEEVSNVVVTLTYDFAEYSSRSGKLAVPGLDLEQF